MKIFGIILRILAILVWGMAACSAGTIHNNTNQDSGTDDAGADNVGADLDGALEWIDAPDGFDAHDGSSGMEENSQISDDAASADPVQGLDENQADVYDIETCMPESESSICTRLGKNCDALQATDNCGAQRTVNCGSCTLPETCGGGDVANVCGPTTPPGTDPYDPNSRHPNSGLTGPFEFISDCSGQTRNVTDYGATPTTSSDDDAPPIQNAINAAMAGDTIFLPNGTYHLRSGGLQLKSNICFRGESSTGVNLIAANAITYGQMINIPPGSTNVGVWALTLQRTDGTVTYAIRIGVGSIDKTANESVDGTGNPVYPTVTRILMADLDVSGYERFGINIENGLHVEVRNCLFHDATATGGGGSGYGVVLAMSKSSDNWIHHNTATGRQDGVADGTGIRHAYLIQYHAHNNLLTYNRAQFTAADGFDFHGEREYANEVAYNTASECTGLTTVSPNCACFGMGEVGAPHGATGPRNWVHNNEGYGCIQGLRLNNEPEGPTWIEDNLFHQNTQYGILSGDLAPTQGTVITGNTLSGNPTNLSVQNCSNCTVSDNIEQ